MTEDMQTRPEENSNESPTKKNENLEPETTSENSNQEHSEPAQVEPTPHEETAPQPAVAQPSYSGGTPKLPSYLQRNNPEPETVAETPSEPITETEARPDFTPEATKVEFNFPYLKLDEERKPAVEKTEPAPAKEPKKPIGQGTFPPGFEFGRKSEIGAIEGHPQEGVPAYVPRPPRPEPEAEIVAEAEAESEPEAVEGDEEGDEVDETLFPEEGAGADAAAHKKRRRRKGGAEKMEQSLADSAAIAEATFAPLATAESTTPAPVVPRVEFRSDRAIDEPVKPPVREPQPERPAPATERPTPLPRPTPQPRTQQPRRDVPAPSQPLNRPESTNYRGGGTRGPVSSGTSEGAIRGRLGGVDKPAQVERPQRESRPEPSRPDSRPDTRNQPPRRPEDNRPQRDTRSQPPYRRREEEDENSLEAMKRKIGELTPTDRKILNYLVSKKKIARNLNEQVEKNVLLSEKIVEVLGSWPIVIIMSVVWIGALASWLLAGEPTTEAKLTFVFLGVAVLWASLVMISFKARIVRDRARAAIDYEIQLKTELDMRALRDRVDGDIAPRIPEIISALKRIEAKVNQK